VIKPKPRLKKERGGKNPLRKTMDLLYRESRMKEVIMLSLKSISRIDQKNSKR